MRQGFTRHHGDTILVEPHKRFIERLNRDLLVHATVLTYELGEVRLRSETIIQKPTWSQTPEQLLKAAKVDVPAVVALSEDAINRIHAFFVGLEYVGQCAWGWFNVTRGPDGHITNVTGGPLGFIKELEIRRRETEGLAFILEVWKRVMEKVHELQTEQGEIFRTFSHALYEVLRHHKNIWSEARLECSLGGRPAKRQRDASPGDEDDMPSRASRRAAQRQRAQGRARQGSEAAKTKQEQKRNSSANGGGGKKNGGGGGGGGNGASGSDRSRNNAGRRAPSPEWRALAKVKKHSSNPCKFFNLTTGCQVNDCKFKHVCWQCGSTSHRWCGAHYKP